VSATDEAEGAAEEGAEPDEPTDAEAEPDATPEEDVEPADEASTEDASAEEPAEPRARVATVCLGGCSGCHMEFLNIDEGLIDLLADVEIVASHMIVDEKGVPEADIGIAEGVVTNEENVEVAEELREHCDVVVAWGDCAALRGIMSLRNGADPDELVDSVYEDAADEESEAPRGEVPVPALLEDARPLDEFVEVDVHIPGCPPDAEVLAYGIEALLAGEEPAIVEEKLQYD